MFLYFLIALLTLSYLWLKQRYSFWERRGVKGPKPVFLFGNLFKAITFQEHPSISQNKWYNTFKDVPYIGFYKLMTPGVMIRDPELIRTVLVKDFMSFHKNDFGEVDKDDLLSRNPFAQNGEDWRRSRAMFGTFFSANRIRAVFPKMIEAGSEWAEYVKNMGADKEIDAKAVASRYTTETMLRCTFSINGHSYAESSEFLDMGKEIFNPGLAQGIRQMITFMLPPIQKILRVKIIPESVEKRFTEVVVENLRARENGTLKSEDLLESILAAKEKYDLNDKDIVGITISFFFEAYETSANVLVLALYELARNPHIQEELARSIEESLKENNGEMSYDLVSKHQYLEKVIYESMRCKPAFFGLQKMCTKSFTMPLLPGQTEPVTIPAGTPIIIPFSSMVQDPELFPHPDEFDPERFAPEEKANRHKAAFIPFSDGPRMCIGMQLALFNLKLGLFQMVRNFEFKFAPSQKPFALHPMSVFNIPKDGVKLHFIPRKIK